MVTEQDVVEYLNKSAKEGQKFKESTGKYMKKLQELENLQSVQQEELKSLNLRLRQAESDLMRTRGAISVILEMVAEEEGLMSSADQKSTNSNNNSE